MNSKFRQLLTLCIAMSLWALFAGPAKAQDPPPNIVFIMVDDLDVSVFNTALNTLDQNGDRLLKNIHSELVAKGTEFEQMFTSQPLCCPSRATFHTGQYPQNHGVVGNDGFYYQGDSEEGIPWYRDTREATALGTWLNRNGNTSGVYRTGHFGKYMNGSGHTDERNDDQNRVVAGWEKWRALVPILRDDVSGTQRAVQCMYGYALSNGAAGPDFFTRADGDYQTDKLAELADDFIRNLDGNGQPINDTRPFMLVVTPTAPHTEGCHVEQDDTFVQDEDSPGYENLRTNKYYKENPHTWVELPAAQSQRLELAKESYDEPVADDKPVWVQNKPPQPGRPRLKEKLLQERKKLFNEKIAALRPVDDMVKRLITALSDTRKLDNTLIVFTSDNGYQYGTHRMDGKQDFYEESTRVPMVVRAPNQTKFGKSQAWVMNNDWAVTIAAYADVNKRVTVDGRSIKNLIENPNAPGARQSLLIRTGFNPGVEPPVDYIDDGHAPYIAIRTRHPDLTKDDSGNTVWVYAETRHPDYAEVGYELYNLNRANEDLQVTNLYEAQKNNQRTKDLQAWLYLLKDCNGNRGDQAADKTKDCRWLEDNGKLPVIADASPAP